MFVPYADTAGGMTLTQNDWQTTDATTWCLSLQRLLVQPGFDLWNNPDQWRTIMGWHGNLILDASNIEPDQDGVTRIHSPRDGSRYTIIATDLRKVVLALRPDAILLARDTDWFCADAVADCEIPAYSSNPATSRDPQGFRMFEAIRPCAGVSRMMLAEVAFADLAALLPGGTRWVISDTPANDALHGLVYTHEGAVDITDSGMATCFEPLSVECDCTTCRAPYLMAALHHLYLHTPLLCKRLLVQHNIRFMVRTFHLPSQ